jgi:hypothetical protein
VEQRHRGIDMKLPVWGLLLCGAGVSAQETVTLSPAPFQMPAKLGPLFIEGAPHQYDDPRLGTSYQFSGPGASLTIYVYDAGVEQIADGADTIAACREFESAKDGVAQSYQGVRLLTQSLARLLPPKDSPQVREAVYELLREGRQKVSYVWVTAAAGNFLKLRFTMDAQFRDELPEARRAILSAVGTAIEPHLAPVDPDAKKPGTSIGINADIVGGGDDDMGAGFMYLMFLTAMADKEPQSVPVCGGEFVPSFEMELGLQRAVFVTGEDGARSRYGKRLAQIEKAGLLEEFVWTELHRDQWGDKAPQGLMLAEYQQWKKKRLKRFKRPEFGSVTVDYPRPLPLEPL